MKFIANPTVDSCVVSLSVEELTVIDSLISLCLSKKMLPGGMFTKAARSIKKAIDKEINSVKK